MQIPMGTVVAATMLVGTLFAFRAPNGGVNQFVPSWLTKAVGFVLGAAGLWNILWYGLRHLTEFWGHMALGSGVVMVAVSALLILPADRMPRFITRLRPILLLLLAGYGAYYAWTIYNL